MSNSPDILQDFGSLANVRIGLSAEVRAQGVHALNRLLAHTMAIRDAYKKAHWQTSGATFHQLHLLFDKHYGEQVLIMDAIAERVQTLGGVTFALAQDVVDESSIARPRAAANRRWPSCRACWTRMKPSCWKRVRWRAQPPTWATTAAMT